MDRDDGSRGGRVGKIRAREGGGGKMRVGEEGRRGGNGI